MLKDARPGGLNAAIPAARNAGLPIALYRMATITTGCWPTDASDVLEGVAERRITAMRRPRARRHDDETGNA